MRARVLVAIVCGVMLVGGCGGEEKSEDGTTTTSVPDLPTTSLPEESDELGTTVPEAPSPTIGPVGDDEFTQAIGSFRSALAASVGDPCGTFNALSSGLPTPANAGQAELAAGAFADMLRQLADSAPPSAAGSAATVRTAADGFLQEAKAAGFEMEKMDQLPSVSSQAFQQAMIAIPQAANCSFNG